MANEAVIIEKGQLSPLRYTVADGSGIEKGAILKLIDPRTASGGNIVKGSICAGIASDEKVAGDGSTSLSFWHDGIFDVKASGAIALGMPITMAPDNYVAIALTTASGAMIIGHALETASDAEVFAARIFF